MLIGFSVYHAVRLNKDDVLFFLNHNPQNKIRVEIALLEETHSFSSAQVSQEEDFLSRQRHVLFGFPVDPQVTDEAFFTLFE